LGIVAEISGTIIRRWKIRSWILPGDPLFEEKVARVLDLYARV
jgi:hypothetical protein